MAGLDHGGLLLGLHHVHLPALGDGRQAGHAGGLLFVGCNGSTVGRVHEHFSSHLGLGSVDHCVLLGRFVSNQVAVVPLVARVLHLVRQEVSHLMLRHASLQNFINPSLLLVLQRFLEGLGDSHTSSVLVTLSVCSRPTCTGSSVGLQIGVAVNVPGRAGLLEATAGWNVTVLHLLAWLKHGLLEPLSHLKLEVLILVGWCLMSVVANACEHATVVGRVVSVLCLGGSEACHQALKAQLNDVFLIVFN